MPTQPSPNKRRPKWLKEWVMWEPGNVSACVSKHANKNRFASLSHLLSYGRHTLGTRVYCPLGVLVEIREDVCLIGSIISPKLPSLFPVERASKWRSPGSVAPAARTGHHRWLHPGWKILPRRIANCSNTNWACHFRCENNNVDFSHMETHYYRVQ